MEHFEKANQLYIEHRNKYALYTSAQRNSFRRRVTKLSKQLTNNDERHMSAITVLGMLETRMNTTFKYAGHH